MKRQNVLTLVTVFIIPLLLFHFQNCAPPSAGVANSSGGSSVGLPENFSKAQIQFVTPQVEVQDNIVATGVDGLCNSAHEGAALTWTLASDQTSSTTFLQGQAVCSHGQFKLQVNHVDEMVCGVSHTLVVEASWGDSISGEFTRRCQPLVSQTMAAPPGSPYGTTCSMEYSAATAAQNPCVQVCYRDQKVVLIMPLEVAQCSSLAAGLASP